jgi:hypothetical protein
MMPKRLFWTSVGYGAGIATSLYVQRRVRRAVVRVVPEDVRRSVGAKGGELSERARDLGTTIRLAAREGRIVMRETEQALRDEHPLPPPRAT